MNLRNCIRFSAALLFFGGSFLGISPRFSHAVAAGVIDRKVGDVDGNGIIDLVDLSKLRKHVWNVAPLPGADLAYADVNRDGVVNEDDAAALIRLINEQDVPQTLPLATIRATSPQNGEEAVSNNRRTGILVRFSLPMELASGTFDSSSFYAEVTENGVARKLVATPQLSSDGTKAALVVGNDKIPSGSRVDVTLRGESLKDKYGRLLDGEGRGVQGGTYSFHYSSEKLVSVKGTLVTGTVFASEKVGGADKPLQGVIVKVAGAQDSTTTDGNGRFSLTCPAGRFFAEVDGRHVLNPNYDPKSSEAYYPFVIKAWEAVAGTSSLAAGTGLIYLPKIPGDALQIVNPGTITTVGASATVKTANPDMKDVSLTVPAGALRNADGSVAAGRVGMAPVAPDRLPQPLGDGLKFPLVITIQTDGAAIFDQPVAVKFPNLPDPVTQVKLKPGEKSALWSFNHDSGEWEMQGPMTVTDDGNYVTTDPGVGVRQPGWHGVLPGSQGVGPKLPAPGQEPDAAFKDDVDKALTIVGEHSLTVRDAFLKLADMRSLAVDLQQVRSLMGELKPLLDSYAAGGSAPSEWMTVWISDRIGKLRTSYEKLFPSPNGGPRLSGNLADDAAALDVLLTRLIPELERLAGFNAKVNRGRNLTRFNDAAYELVDANDRLRLLINDWPDRVAKLKRVTPLMPPDAFRAATNVLFPGFNGPKPGPVQILDALVKFAAAVEPVYQIIDSDYSTKLRELEDKMSVYLRCAGTLATAGRPLPTEGYWLLQSAGEQRNKSNTIGTYRMVLPPNREFALTYVDPTTLRVGAYVGFSSGNGIITDLYGPVLAPIPDTAILQKASYTADSKEVSCDTTGLRRDMTVYGIPSGSDFATVQGLKIIAVSSGSITLSGSLSSSSVSALQAPGAKFRVSASLSAYGVDSDGDLLVDVIEKVVGTYSKAAATAPGVPVVDPKNSDGKGLSDYRALLKGENPLNGLAAATGVVFKDPPSKSSHKSVDVATGDDLLLSAETQSPSGYGSSNVNPGPVNPGPGALVVYDIQNKTVPVRKGVFPLASGVLQVRYGQGKLAVLVLGGTAGVGVLDISKPDSTEFAVGDPNLLTTFGVSTGETVSSAVLIGDIVVAGVNGPGEKAQIRAFDRRTGVQLMSCDAGDRISDLISNGTVVYALSRSEVPQGGGQDWSWWARNSVVFAGDLLNVKPSQSPDVNKAAADFRSFDVRVSEYWWQSSRLALAKGRLFVVRPSGLTSFKIGDPLRPQREGDVFLPSRSFGFNSQGNVTSGTTEAWGNIVFDGSEKDGKSTFIATLGLGTGYGDLFVYQFGTADKFKSSSNQQLPWWAGFSNNYPGDGAPAAVFSNGRYSGRTDDFSTQYAGQPASSVRGMAMAGGIVYAADSEAGVFAVNYQSFDDQQQPPEFDGPVLMNSQSSAQMTPKRFSEGDLISVRADVKDDVALASVKWYVNGQQTAVTSGYPWAYTMSAGSVNSSYLIEARVFDTGGNFASSGTVSIGVVGDASPPMVAGVSPEGGNPVVPEIKVTFNKAMDLSSAGAGAVKVYYSGEDFNFDASDLVFTGSLSLLNGGSAGTVTAGSLAFPMLTSNGKGRYKVTLSGNLADTSGNLLKGNTASGDYEWSFAVSDVNEWIGADGLGGDGLWLDARNWKNGYVPAPNERVYFGPLASGTARTVLGGRSQFVATDSDGHPLPYLPSGEKVFTSVYKATGSATFSWASLGRTGVENPLPVLAVRSGMNVKGRYVAPGTTVKSVTSVDDAYDVTNQRRTVQVVLDKPIGEAGGGMPWSLGTPVTVAGLEIAGETNLVDVDLTVTGGLELKSATTFAGESSIVAGTLFSSGSGRLVVASAATYNVPIRDGSPLPYDSGKGLLRFPAGLTLGSDLEIENAGGYDKSELQVDSGSLSAGAASAVNLGGRTLKIRAGDDSLGKFGALKGARGVHLLGGGTLNVAWKSGADKKLRISASKMNLPAGFEIQAPGSGTVEILSPEFVSSGRVGVMAGGSLAIYNYSGSGSTAATGSLDLSRTHRIARRSNALPVSGAERSSMALLGDSGNLWTWGNNASGQLGNGDKTDLIRPGTLVSGPATTSGPWSAVSFIGSAMLGVKGDGTMHAWGNNGVSSFMNRNLDSWVSYSTTTQGYGSLGIGSKERFAVVPVQIGEDHDWADVFAYNDYPGSEYTNYHQPYNRNYNNNNYDYYYSYYYLAYGSGYGSYYAIKEDGTLWRWSNFDENNYNKWGSSGLPPVYPTRVDESWAWTAIAQGGAQVYGLKADGTLWSWERQAGKPAQIGSAHDWKSVVAGRFSVFAVNTAGELYAWKDNSFGQLGLGDVASQDQPQKVPSPQGLSCRKVVVSDFSTYAIFGGTSVAAGSLYACGKNDEGQLGVGNDDHQNTFKLVSLPSSSTASGWTDVVAFGDMALGQDDTGALWAWGNNFSGKLGAGSSEVREQSPKEVVHPGQKKWKEVTMGGDFLHGKVTPSYKGDPYYAPAIHAVDSDGGVWAWGYNGDYTGLDGSGSGLVIQYPSSKSFGGGALGVGSKAAWVTEPKAVTTGSDTFKR